MSKLSTKQQRQLNDQDAKVVKRSSVNVTPEALHQAQVASAMLGQTMQDFCSQAIRDAAAKVEAEYQKTKVV